MIDANQSYRIHRSAGMALTELVLAALVVAIIVMLAAHALT
jgi:Tfp pilus assembly protein FimT